MTAQTVPLYLVSGFLGSGKSSFLRNIIEEMGDCVKIGVVQNEFSPVNIDSRILAQSKKPFFVLEVNKGSVFCLCLLNDFIPSLAAFIEEFNPDKIFIEATGLADPLAILQMLNNPLLSGKTRFARAITIVDAPVFVKQSDMLKSVSNQVRIADTVLVNKCDKLIEEEALSAGRRVRELNPFCNILYSQFAKPDKSELEIIKSDCSSAQALKNIIISDSKPLSSPPDIKVNTLVTAKKISAHSLEKLTELLKPMMRAKGFVRMEDGSAKTIQAVNGDVSVMDYSLPAFRSELVFFGETINLSSIEKLFDQ